MHPQKLQGSLPSVDLICGKWLTKVWRAATAKPERGLSSLFQHCAVDLLGPQGDIIVVQGSDGQDEGRTLICRCWGSVLSPCKPGREQESGDDGTRRKRVTTRIVGHLPPHDRHAPAEVQFRREVLRDAAAHVDSHRTPVVYTAESSVQRLPPAAIGFFEK